jgi:RHS repeat-associated protein
MRHWHVKLFVILWFFAAASTADAQHGFAPRIPIKIPRGTRDMQPNLALVYNPNTGEGPIGMGWSLTGLSAVSRVNYGNGINFNGHDTYAHSDTGVLIQQPGDGRTYRSKKDSFMRFERSVEDCGDGPCSWTATDRSGTKYFYGATTTGVTCTVVSSCDSQLWVTDGAGVKIWGLSGVQDLFGNRYEIVYNAGADILFGKITPSTITYTKGTGLTTFHTIDFAYMERLPTDAGVEKGFYSTRGYMEVATKRLSAITISSGGPLRRYVLNYQNGISYGGSGRSELVSIQEQVRSGDTWVSLPAYTFDWQQGRQGFSLQSWGTDNFAWSSLVESSRRFFTGDFDGDGLTDIASAVDHFDPRTNQHQLYFYVHRSKDPSLTAQQWAPGNYAAQKWLGDAYSTFLTGDFDGDGFTDIAYVHADGQWHDLLSIDIYRSNGRDGFYRENWLAPGGWPGWRTSQRGAPDWQQWGMFFVGDFDGDGRSDIAYRYGAQSTTPPYDYHTSMEVYRSNSSSFTSTSTLFSEQGWDTNWQSYETFVTGDFDGDGRTDILELKNMSSNRLIPGAIGIYAYLANGRFDRYTTGIGISNWGTSNVTWQCANNWVTCGTFLTGDFNGDGKTDVVYLWDNRSNLDTVGKGFFLSAGNGYSVVREPGETLWFGGTNWQTRGIFLKGDFNGDGKTDIAYVWRDFLFPDSLNIDVFLYRSSHLSCDDCRATYWQRWASLQGSWIGSDDWQRFSTFLTGDFNGDGKADVLYAREDTAGLGSIAYDLRASNAEIPDLMTTVHNGEGGTQVATYVAAPRVPGAVAPETPIYPIIPNSTPQQLVTQVITDDGRSGRYRVDYAYDRACFFAGPIPTQRNLGFYRLKSTDFQTGQSIESYFKQSPGQEGQVSDVYVCAGPNSSAACRGSAQVMSHSHYDYAMSYPSSGTESAQLQSETDEVYEDGILAYSRTTRYQYDNYGNVNLTSLVANGLRFDDGELSTSTTYSYDTTNWIVDRASEIEVYSGASAYKGTVFVWQGNELKAVRNKTDQQSWVESRMTYTPNGLVHTISEPPTTDQLDRTTTIDYDDVFHSLVKSIIHPQTTTDGSQVAHVIRMTYRPDEQLETITDQSRAVTTFTYDSVNRLHQVMRPDGGKTTYEYVDAELGNPNTQRIEITTATDANRDILARIYFDGLGFVYRTERTGDSGQKICVFATKDAAGRLFQISNPTYNCAHGGSAWTALTYDSAGRIRRVTSPDTRERNYGYGRDHQSPQRFVSLTDANGRVTSWYFNALEQLASVVDAADQSISYGYDSVGRLNSVALPGVINPIRIWYDWLDRKTEIYSGEEGGTTSYDYYANGNVKRVANGGVGVEYKYDALNRVILKSPDGENAVTYKYDEPVFPNSVGRLTTVTDDSGVAHYGYTVLGQVSTIQRIIDGLEYSSAYKYDAGGRLYAMIHPDGSTADYTFTDGGNLSSVALSGVMQATWLDYDAFGMPGSVSYANGVSTIYTRDVMQHLTHIKTMKGSTTLQEVSLDWYYSIYPTAPTNGLVIGNIVDNRADKTLAGTNTDESQIYVYDPLYRISSAMGAWGPRQYGYDGGSAGVGNPTIFGGYTQRSLTFLGQQVTSGTDGANWNLSNVLYDGRGNLAAKTLNGDQWRYGWTTENRLASAMKNGAPLASMVYDESGQRVKKTTSPQSGQTITTRYIDGTYEAQEFQSGEAKAKYSTVNIYGNGGLVLSRTVANSVIGSLNVQGPALGTYFYHTNHLGSSTMITDANGDQQARITYLPFGEIPPPNVVQSDLVTHKYTGQQADEELGIYYYNARYYDPSIARFMSLDSIVPDPFNAQNYNRYSYTLNSPVNQIDPSGHGGGDECDVAPCPGDWESVNPSGAGGSTPNLPPGCIGTFVCPSANKPANYVFADHSARGYPPPPTHARGPESRPWPGDTYGDGNTNGYGPAFASLSGVGSEGHSPNNGLPTLSVEGTAARTLLSILSSISGVQLEASGNGEVRLVGTLEGPGFSPSAARLIRAMIQDPSHPVTIVAVQDNDFIFFSSAQGPGRAAVDVGDVARFIRTIDREVGESLAIHELYEAYLTAHDLQYENAHPASVFFEQKVLEELGSQARRGAEVTRSLPPYIIGRRAMYEADFGTFIYRFRVSFGGAQYGEERIDKR